MTLPNGTRFWDNASHGKPFAQQGSAPGGGTVTFNFGGGTLYSWILTNQSASEHFDVTLITPDGSAVFTLYAAESIYFNNGEMPLTGMTLTGYNSGASDTSYRLVGNLSR